MMYDPSIITHFNFQAILITHLSPKLMHISSIYYMAN